MAENIQEYVIALSSKIDNQGVSRILSLLDSTKLKALGITTAISAATTAVYKFVESATKEELRLQQLAKQRQKNIEQIRSTETAMKSMGKTLNEINKDKALKEIYQDIVKFNDSLALPKMDEALNRINILRGAVWKLKSVVQYAIQWINAKVLTNLAGPLDRITNKLNEISRWVSENLASITSKISSYVTGFAKGIVGIVEGFDKISVFVKNLPDGIKNVGVAVGAVFALLKSGPVGQILVAIEMIGGLIDDFENFKWNQANPDKEQVGIAFPGIWELLEADDQTWEEKTGAIAEKLLGGLTTALNNLADSFQFENIFGDGSESGNGIISKATEWIDKHTSLFGGLSTALLRAVSNGFETGVGTVGSGIGWVIEQLLGTGTVDPNVIADGSTGATFATAIGGFVKAFTDKAKDPNSTLFQKIFAGVEGGGLGAILGSLISNVVKDDEGNITIDWEKVGVNLEALGQSIFGIVTQAIDKAGDIGSVLFSGISKALNGVKAGNEEVNGILASIGTVFDGLSNNETLSDGITTAAVTLFSGGNILESIVTGILGSFTGARKEALQRFESSGARYTDSDVNALAAQILGVNVVELGESVLNLFLQGIAMVDNFGSRIYGAIASLLGEESSLGSLVSVLAGEEGKGSVIGEALTEGILGGLASGNFIVGLATFFGSIITDIQGGKGEELKTELKRLGEEVGHLLFGNEEKGETGLFTIIGEFFDGLWNGKEGEGTGLKDKLLQLASEIGTLLEPVGTAIKEFFTSLFDDLWVAIYNSAPPVVRDALSAVGFVDPNKSSISKTEEEGAYELTSTSGGKATLTGEQANTLAPYIGMVVGDEEGNWRFTREASAQGNMTMFPLAGTVNQNLTKYINGEIDSETFRRNAVSHFNFEKISQTYDPEATIATRSYGVYADEKLGKNYVFSQDINGNIDWQSGYRVNDRTGELTELTGERLSDLSEKAKNGSLGLERVNMESSEAADQLDILSDAFIKLKDNVDALAEVIAGVSGGEGGEGAANNAYGGRYSSPLTTHVAEDYGTEYIIPIRKLDRALPLINQMLAEMGASLSGRVMGGLGVGEAGTLGASLGSVADMITGGNTSNVYTISAPVSIVVNANGADGEAIGRGAYDAAEQQLLETVRGVFA